MAQLNVLDTDIDTGIVEDTNTGTNIGAYNIGIQKDKFLDADERKFLDADEFASQLDYIKYSKNVEHPHSEGIALLYDLIVSYVERCEKAYNEGKNAVWTSALWEVPLIYACGAIPVSYTEAGRLSSPNAISIAEDHFQIPRETCSMVKAALGEWTIRKNGVKRILSYGSFCEPYNHATELLKDEGFDVHFVDTPYNTGKKDEKSRKEAIKFVVEELRKAAEWLGGEKLDEEKLRFEIRRMNQTMGKVRKIVDLRIQKPLFMRSLPTMLMIMGVGHYFGDPEKYNKALDLITKELENADESKFKGKDLIPLIWAGGRGQEFGVYKTIDDFGGAILGWSIPTPFFYDYDETVPPLESIARYLLEGKQTGGGANVFFRERLEDQIEYLKTKGHDVKGIILYGYFGCSFAPADFEMIRNYFEKKNIQSFIIEGTFQVGPPTGQLVTRIRAFIEMLS